MVNPKKIVEELRAQRLKYEFPKGEDGARLRELILYIANKCEFDSTFSAVKLNKILYFADFRAYLRLGEPITGVAYIKLDHGPVPEHFDTVWKKMEDSSEIVIKPREYHGHVQRRLIALREANLNLFKPQEIALLDQVIEELREKTAASVSRQSHGKAWQLAGYGERIPYNAAFLSDEPITDEDIALTQRLASERGWEVPGLKVK